MNDGNGYHRHTIAELEQELREHSPSKFSAVLNSDLANAARLARRHGRDLRFASERGWLVWDGRRWRTDDGNRVMAKAKDTVKCIFVEIESADPNQQTSLFNWARRSQSADKIKAMVYLAQSEPGE